MTEELHSMYSDLPTNEERRLMTNVLMQHAQSLSSSSVNVPVNAGLFAAKTDNERYCGCVITFPVLFSLVPLFQMMKEQLTEDVTEAAAAAVAAAATTTTAATAAGKTKESSAPKYVRAASDCFID